MGSLPIVSSPDPDGTPPVPLDRIDSDRLRTIFLSNSTAKLCTDVVKWSLFTDPFEVTMTKNGYGGEDGTNSSISSSNSAPRSGTGKTATLDPTVKDAFARDWMPALSEIHDWIFQFGIAPYYMESSSIDGEEDALPSKETTEARSKSEGEEKKKAAKDENSFFYYDLGRIVVPKYECGFISTYIDSKGNQKFMWTWFPSAMPAKFIEKVTGVDRVNPGRSSSSYRNVGYTDPNVEFLIREAPTPFGKFTCKLVSILKDYMMMFTKKSMTVVSMKNALNPLFFIEKADTKSKMNKSDIEEQVNGRSSNFNVDVAAESLSAYINPRTGEFEGPFGRSFSFESDPVYGMYDAGVANSARLDAIYRSSAMRCEGDACRRTIPNYRALMETLKANHAGRGSVYSPRCDRGGSGTDVGNFAFDFGGMEDPSMSYLAGEISIDPDEPVFYNSMSGVSFRSKRLCEGEKISEPKNDDLSKFTDATPTLQTEAYLNKNISYVAGYPIELIQGIVGGGAVTSSPKSGGIATGKTASSGGQKPSEGYSARDFAVDKLKQLKKFYEIFLGDLFRSRFEESIALTEREVIKSFPERYRNRTTAENAVRFSVFLPVSFPKPSFGELVRLKEHSIVTDEEFVRISRAQQGLSLDVLQDPTFMAKVKKTLALKYDEEERMKLVEKYTPKPAPGQGGGGAAKPKKKKTGEGESKKRKESPSGKESAAKKKKTTK
jgi:hypothetical protein